MKDTRCRAPGESHAVSPWYSIPWSVPRTESKDCSKVQILGFCLLLSAYLLRPKEDSHQPLVT